MKRRHIRASGRSASIATILLWATIVAGAPGGREPDEVVVRAKRPSTASERSPGSVTLIRLSESEGRDRSLPDILEQEAGVRIRRYGGRGAYTTVSLRGANPNQVRIFLDGIPLNNAVTGEVNLADLDPGAFSTIEVRRSAAGHSAPAGSVHLETGDLLKQRRGREVEALAGSFGTAGAGARAFDGAAEPGDWGYNVGARGEISRQDYRFRNDNGTPILNRFDDFDDERQNAGYRNLFSTAAAARQFGQTRVSALNDFVYRLTGIPGPTSTPTEKVRRKYVRNTGGVSTDSRGLGADWLRLKTRAYYTESREGLDDYRREFSFSLPNSRTRLQQYGVELEPYAYVVDHGHTLRLHSGLERQIYHADRRDRFDELVEREPTRFRATSFARLEDEISFFRSRLVLLPALAVERHADRFHEPELSVDPATGLPGPTKKVTEFTHYSFGVTVSPLRTRQWHGKLRALAETGGRMPLFVELFGERGTLIGNPALEPETSELMEAGGSLAATRKLWKGELSLTAFRRIHRDLILFIPNSQFTLRPDNVDAAEVRGAEVSARLRIGRWLRSHANYTYQRAINQSDLPFVRGKYLPLRPLHELQTGASLEGEHHRVGFELSVVGASFRDRSNEVTGYVPARAIANVFYVWSVFGRSVKERRWLLGLELKNIADVRAFDVTGFPLPGRSLYVKTHYRF